MARVCELSGRGPLSGNKRSHSLRATRRKWNVNLQKKTIVVNGKKVVVNVSTRALRSLNGPLPDNSQTLAMLRPPYELMLMYNNIFFIKYQY